MIPCIRTLISCIPTPIPHIPTLLPHIPIPIPHIPTLIPRIPTPIPHIHTLIPLIPTLILCIPTLIPRVPTMIPCMPIILLIPFFVSPFRLLQIAGDFYYLLKPKWNNALLIIAHETENNKLNTLFTSSNCRFCI